MASPLNPVAASEASPAEGPSISSTSQSPPRESPSKDVDDVSQSKRPSFRPTSDANLPLSPGRGRSRIRPTSASTRFPVAVKSNAPDRISSPPLSPSVQNQPPSGRFREIFPVAENNLEGTDIGQEPMPIGLENFEVGEASDDGKEESKSQSKSTVDSKKNKRDKGKGKEKAKSKGKEKAVRGKGKEQEKESRDNKPKGKDVVKELFTPLRAKLAPIMHQRSGMADAGPSTQQRQTPHDPGHRELQLGKPNEDFEVVDLEAQIASKNAEVCVLWKVAMAVTMTLNFITFILVAAILWAINNKV